MNSDEVVVRYDGLSSGTYQPPCYARLLSSADHHNLALRRGLREPHCPRMFVEEALGIMLGTCRLDGNKMVVNPGYLDQL